MERVEWLAKRRETLGASEVAAVCGLDPFKSAWDIWAVKKGYRQETNSDAGDMGNRIEPVLLQWYADKTGRPLRQVGTLRHPVETWASATPDGVAPALDVQAKVVGARMLHRWDDGPPHYVHVQVGWEMWVTELPAAEVVALLGGTDPQIFPVAPSRLKRSRTATTTKTTRMRPARIPKPSGCPRWARDRSSPAFADPRHVGGMGKGPRPAPAHVARGFWSGGGL